MTLIDLTNVRDLTVVAPLEEASAADAAGCLGGACHAGPAEHTVEPVERARG